MEWKGKEGTERHILWQKHVAIVTVNTYILQGLFVYSASMLKHWNENCTTCSDMEWS